jgi:hypothetical protein
VENSKQNTKSLHTKAEKITKKSIKKKQIEKVKCIQSLNGLDDN